MLSGEQRTVHPQETPSCQPSAVLPVPGVVRVALPQKGHIFCTWLVTLTRESLVERAGVLPATRLDQLAAALRLAQVE